MERVMTREETLLSIGIQPLSRRLSLRYTAFARTKSSGKEEKKREETFRLEWIEALAASARFWRTLVVRYEEGDLLQPSSLERGSAATRTVVRSISRSESSDELTHISRINRR